MTRPEIVRADTIDLQDPQTPSAKDHTRQPASPKPLGDGPPAPHQAQSLRKASLDGYDLHVRSPRASKDLSDKELQLLHDAEPDEHDAAAENEQISAGGQEVVGQDMGADEDDDELDDDMMDKISSSPSIDDGVYISPAKWPCRKDSLLQLRSKFEKEGMLFGSVKQSQQLRRTTSTIWGTMRGTGSMPGDEENVMESPSQFASESGARFQPRFETYPEDPEIELCESDFEQLEASGVGELSCYPEEPLFDVDFNNRILYGFETQDSDRPIEGAGDDWKETISVEDILKNDASWDDLDDRFVDSGWGGECLREIEDIDFEFVYALHTFVATVEGQANATKGDTMVLLDDSNSYWWLVKVVKDSSIGYLPAEHIETPTERLARLNKHRNIDVNEPYDPEYSDANSIQLSQTMLGDNPEKSRNPLKKAMRKRNQKSVAFAEPQYFEPSEPSYSSDEEDEMSPAEQLAARAAEAHQAGQVQQAQQQASETSRSEDQIATVEPLRSQKLQSNGVEDQSPIKDANGQFIERDQPRPSTESMDSEEGTGRRRIRNTDSFYKDDTVETKKISLTPNLLKDESNSNAPQTVSEPRSSVDSLKSNEKAPVVVEKDKKKEKKEKKGVLGGLFKRKNSKSKQEKEKEKDEKDDISGTTAIGSSLHSVDSISIESSLSSPTSTTAPHALQQKSGKLQKAPPPAKLSSIPKRTATDEPTESKTNGADGAVIEPSRALSPIATQPGPDASMAPAPLQSQSEQSTVRAIPQEVTTSAKPTSPPSASRGIFSPIQTMLGGSPSTEPKEPKPEKVKKAKNRMALEDSETSEDEASTPQQASVLSNLPANLRPVPEPVDTARAAKQQRLSESPVEVSPVQQSHLHPAHASTSTNDAPPSPLSANSTPELVDHPSESEVLQSHARSMQQAPVITKTPDVHATPSASETSSPVTASSQPQWSPARLRAYLDSEGANDVRDLILLVHDTSDVKDLPQNHELVRGFSGDRQRLDVMSKRLDDLLGEVLSRRSAPAA